MPGNRVPLKVNVPTPTPPPPSPEIASFRFKIEVELDEDLLDAEALNRLEKIINQIEPE